MRGILLVIVGLCVGIGLGKAQPVERDIVSLNHIAIAVEDLDAEAVFFSDVLGFPEAFSVVDQDGATMLAYHQINRSTFVELLPVTAGRPAGFAHFGLEVTNADAVIKRLEAAGANVRSPFLSSFTGARIGGAESPSGAFFEVLEFGPDSLPRKAMDAWH